MADIKELVIVTKDRVGLLADISEVLGRNKINIESVSADVVGKNAVVRLVVSDEKKGKAALKKAGFNPVASDTLVVTLEDKPGELSRMARMLSDEGINMTNVYHLGKEKGKALVGIKFSEKKHYSRARKILSEFL